MNRTIRSPFGGTLALVAAAAVVICIVGVAIFLLMQLFGGSLEIQHGTDAGNLNVAKQAVKIGPGLKNCNAVAQANFGAAVDDNGSIDLLTYNRAVGQTLLVAMNAESEGTATAKANAVTLKGALDDVGQQLSFMLKQPTLASQSFDVAKANNLKMLGDGDKKTVTADDNQYGVAYMSPNSPTNVWLDSTILPPGVTAPANLTSNHNCPSSPGGSKPFMAGYNEPPIMIGDVLVDGVPVQPDHQPNLVSAREFEARMNAPQPEVPPNSFRYAGAAQSHVTKTDVGARSYAMVGVLDNAFPVSVPQGYIKIFNPKGYHGPDTLPSTDNIFNNELMSGIFLLADKNGKVVAFSTDVSALNKIAAHNKDPKVPMPPLVDNQNQPTVYLADGTPVNSAAQLANATQLGSPTTGCFASNVGGDGAVPQCSQMMPAFGQAYPHDTPTVAGDPAELTAVEEMKNETIQAYGAAWPQWDAAWRAGQSVQQANIPGPIPDISAMPPGYSGLRLFTHGATYLAPPLKFTTPGTPTQLLAQIVSGDGGVQTQVDGVLDQLVQRVREIKPEATKAEVINVLNTCPAMDLNSIVYLYMKDLKTRQLVTSFKPPAWVKSATEAPDGNVQIVQGMPYDTIPTIANPPHELGAHDVLFYVNPDSSVTGVGHDEVRWTPSSGFNNLLGVMEFRNVVTGGGTFYQPN